MVVVDLDDVEELTHDDVRQILHDVAADRRIHVGVRTRPPPDIGPGWWVIEAMSTTVAPREIAGAAGHPHRSAAASLGSSIVEVDDLDAVLAAIRATVKAAPHAAEVLDDLLRRNARLPAAQGMLEEWWATMLLPCRQQVVEDVVTGDDDRDAFQVTIRAGNIQVTVGRERCGQPGPGHVHDVLAQAIRGTVQAHRSGAVPDSWASDPAERDRWFDESVLARMDHPGAVVYPHRHHLAVHLCNRVDGPGLEIAAFARRATADPRTRLALSHLRRHRILDSGGSVSIPSRIGRWRTAFLVLSGLEIDAATALRWNLIDALTQE